MDIRDFALMMLGKLPPNIANSPANKQMIEAIKNNDSKAGEEIANNLLNSFGDTKENAVKKASNFFNFPRY